MITQGVPRVVITEVPPERFAMEDSEDGLDARIQPGILLSWTGLRKVRLSLVLTSELKGPG